MREDLQRVELTWLDSVSLSGWRSMSEVRAELMQTDSLIHVTVGLLLAETNDCYLLALSTGVRDDAEVDAAIAIPRRSVLTITPLAGTTKTHTPPSRKTETPPRKERTP